MLWYLETFGVLRTSINWNDDFQTHPVPGADTGIWGPRPPHTHQNSRSLGEDSHVSAWGAAGFEVPGASSGEDAPMGVKRGRGRGESGGRSRRRAAGRGCSGDVQRRAAVPAAVGAQSSAAGAGGVSPHRAAGSGQPRPSAQAGRLQHRNPCLRGPGGWGPRSRGPQGWCPDGHLPSVPFTLFGSRAKARGREGCGRALWPSWRVLVRGRQRLRRGGVAWRTCRCARCAHGSSRPGGQPCAARDAAGPQSSAVA